MLAKTFCFLLSIFVAIEAQFVIDRGEQDVFRNLTGCSEETPDFCYFLHSDKSPFDPCVCRCWPKYPMYRDHDVFPVQRGEFESKGKPGCVWHSNHRYGKCPYFYHASKTVLKVLCYNGIYENYVRVNCGWHVDGFCKWNLECEFYDDSRHRLNFDLCKKNKIHHHSQKEHVKISKIAKFACEIL